MPLQSIEAQRLYQRVAAQVAELIRAGEWPVGDRLPPERDLAAQLGVSRPVVREAMIALELAQLIEIRPGAGTFVRGTAAATAWVPQDGPDAGPSPFDLIAARRLLEGETAATAAQRADAEAVAALQAANATMAAEVDRGAQHVDNGQDGDLQFHLRIAGMSGNGVLVAMVEQLWEGMRRPMFAAISRKARLPANARRAIAEHAEVIERIAAGDAEGARRAMHRHLDRVEHVLLRD